MIRRMLLLLIAAVLPLQASAEDAAERGRALVERSCAGCHAVGPAGESPLAAAPHFRTLGRRFDIGDLEEALAEGIVTGHPEMPEFIFAPDEVGAILAYLRSIQTR